MMIKNSGGYRGIKGRVSADRKSKKTDNGVPETFDKNVFINCPFDDRFLPLFHSIIFAVHDLGFRPRCALEASNAGEVRIDKIVNIISECKYSIHDISRTDLDPVHRLPRFNMPLELGLDLGCKWYGANFQQEKVLLVMDIEKHRYQKFISDIAGQDIYDHGSNEQNVIKVVRKWFRPEIDPFRVTIPSGDEIFKRFQTFKSQLPSICKALKLDSAQLEFLDFSHLVSTWIADNPL
jgi:hypothetical protein